ncbi:hypothetical protein ACOMCU_28025, partial [Lysinibacillus sp. UGB7]|uniref:hypothetical protein n=1 Tax=Lysinibacillus sp. UGB7 TaxID=3411039 RepID=UPI003B79248C
YRSDNTAFGEYTEEELRQMKHEGWCVAHSINLTNHKIRHPKNRKHVQGKVVGVNRNGIRVMQ